MIMLVAVVVVQDEYDDFGGDADVDIVVVRSDGSKTVTKGCPFVPRKGKTSMKLKKGKNLWFTSQKMSTFSE